MLCKLVSGSLSGKHNKMPAALHAFFRFLIIFKNDEAELLRVKCDTKNPALVDLPGKPLSGNFGSSEDPGYEFSSSVFVTIPYIEESASVYSSQFPTRIVD